MKLSSRYFCILLLYCVFVALAPASAHDHGGGGNWHGGGDWHHPDERVYAHQPWYHHEHVYYHHGSAYPHYYYGHPYYYYDPNYYYWNEPVAAINVDVNLP